MKAFLKSLLTSCLGSLLALGSIVVFFLVWAMSAGSGKPAGAKPNSILKLDLSKPIPELTDNVERGYGDLGGLLGGSASVGLYDLQRSIEEAAKDENIKGIYMEMSSTPIGLSTAKKIRQSLEAFRASGKFVIAYASAYSQRSYYIASAADRVYLHPLGGMDFMGFSAQLMFLKGAMDKVGVKAQVFYAGKFKSATEPLRMTAMSPENRLQTREYIEGSYALYLDAIAASRSIPAATLRELANTGALRKAEDAVANKLVDSLLYKDQVLADLRTRLGLKADEEIPSISSGKYYKSVKKDLHYKSSDNRIAIVYAEGGIVDGEGGEGGIGGEKYARILREIQKDESVKAVVIRINSGGGSALASDIIWREIEQIKNVRKIPVVSTMGDVAASGGYYIACNSDCIYAEDNTITGSIGVFGLVPNMRDLYENKLGITMDTIKTGKFSTMSSDMGLYYEFNPEEAALIQKGVDDIYTTFKQRVAAGRKIPFENVDTLAQGRVWLGTTAQKNGLVDSLGGLQEAIAHAARLANITEYRVALYPEIEDGNQRLMNLLTGNESGGERSDMQPNATGMVISGIEAEMPELAPLFRFLRQIRQMKGVQARMPFEIWID